MYSISIFILLQFPTIIVLCSYVFYYYIFSYLFYFYFYCILIEVFTGDMSLGLIAGDQGRRHHLPAPIHHLIRTRTEKQNKKETNISIDANLLTM